MKFCSYFYVAVTIFIHDRIAFVCLVCADLYALFMLLVSLYKLLFDQTTTRDEVQVRW